ncbi:MAG TPA: ankyrin repeat domain-containing protein, partial [Rhodanobacteraceae bacterium]|nr:ankyrin repeat domain-containing protein [Rhodanobacteraceae bacterium]
LARRSPSERADDFLAQATDRAGGPLAAHILRKHPDVARFSMHTAVVAGDLVEVERRLAADPSSASAVSGPQKWQPLQYLCYARVPLAETAEHAVAIARALLDAGADPNAEWNEGWETPFTLLTGVIGDGEQRHAPHARAVELAELLIERGANPYDAQSLYNTSLSFDDTFWLDFLYSRSAIAGGAERWRSSEAWPANGMLDYLIGNAVSRNHLKRTRWLLEHGAHATAKHFYNKRNLHTEAVLGGFTELAQLLLDFGARLERLDDVHAFQAACMSTDRDAARRLLAAHPEYRHFPGPMYQAAGRDRVDVAELLLELGMSPDVEHGGWVALHSTAHSNSVCVAKLLIQRGATIDIRENKYHSTPLGHAVWAGNQDMVDVLSAVSRDLVALARAGKLERLSALLDEDPSLAKAMRDGRTALYFLSAPEERAVEIAELLLARGADPKHKDAEGLTAADAAAKSGLEELAALLRDAQSPGQEVGT